MVLILALAPAAGAQTPGVEPDLSPPAIAGKPSGGAVLGDPREQFSAANRLYEEGRFAEAAGAYQAIAAAGYASPALYFNLGNAFLKAGELGEAIVYYERARALDPRGEDIRTNLAYARSLTVDVMPDEGGSAFLLGLVRIRDAVAPEEALWVAVAAFWLTAGALILGQLRGSWRRVARGVALGGLALLVLAGGLAAIRIHAVSGNPRAFLIEPEVQVRSGPGAQFSTRFTLHEGTGVQVLREAGDWLEIELTATMNGWVPKGSLLEL